MSVWRLLVQWLTPALGRTTQPFSLGDRGEQPDSEQTGSVKLVEARRRTAGVLTHIDNLLEAGSNGAEAVEKVGDLSASLSNNVTRLEELFRLPQNKDLVIREFQIATQPPTRAVVCFMDGLADKTVINDNVLQPLMLLSHLDHHVGSGGERGLTKFSIQTVLERLLPGHSVDQKHDMDSLAETLLMGDAILLFEGERTAISVETKSPPGRSVGEPKNEQVVLGPHDAFTEGIRTNTGLIRRRLKDPRLVTEMLTVGSVGKTTVAVMYVDGIVTPKLVTEVKRRIDAVKVDAIHGSDALLQYIEDAPASLMPAALATERPDRVAAYLSEGHVAVVVDTSPNVLILPMTFWSLLQTSEDYYLRFPFGTLLRYLRLIALLFTLVVPAVYIAVVNFHQEMLPTELLLFIAESRETVPMPAVVELLLMELVFELIREAGTRIPSLLGPTIGLVAGLILGNAAVEAKLVSPIMIIIVAVTGLASFAIPNYLTAFGIRSVRFVLVGAAMLLGFFGLGAAFFVLTVYLSGMRSFGVPYLSPIAPRRGGSPDVFNRQQLFMMEKRPAYTRPLDKQRQAPIIRTWDPLAPQDSLGVEQGGDQA